MARVLRAVIGAYRLAASVLLVAGCLGQLVLIIMRNLVSVEPAWATVAVTLCLAVGGLLFIGLCPSHIAFRVGDRVFGRSAGVRVLRDLIGAAITGALTYVGIKAALDQRQLGATFQSLNVQVWIAMLAIPIASGALTLRFVADVWLEVLTSVRGWRF